MDIGHIKGSGGIERGAEKAQRADKVREQHGDKAVAHDSATISESSRETLQSVERLTEKLKEEQPEREQIVADVKSRLESGEYDNFEVFHKVANTLLES